MTETQEDQDRLLDQRKAAADLVARIKHCNGCLNLDGTTCCRKVVDWKNCRPKLPDDKLMNAIKYTLGR